MLEKNGREYFTSLLAVYTAVKKLRRLFRKKKGSPERHIENVENFEIVVKSFFDFVLCHVPSYKQYFTLRKTTLRRERANNKNLFFRPIGLEILARLYAIYTKSGSGSGIPEKAGRRSTHSCHTRAPMPFSWRAKAMIWCASKCNGSTGGRMGST